MDITYIGHSCFKLKGKSGTVVTDPYDSSVGFPFPKLSADIVTVSHQHSDHNAVSRVEGTPRRETPFIISAPGEYDVMGITVFGFPSFHDDERGRIRGQNTIMIVRQDGVSVAHLGDLGHTLSEKQIEGIGTVDVLLIPVGGLYTIDAGQAAAIIEAIEPSVTIPMHYHMPSMAESFSGLMDVERFLKETGKEGIVPQEKLVVSSESLPSEPSIVVLNPAW